MADRPAPLLKDSDRYLTHGPLLELLESMWPGCADLDPFHDPDGPRLAHETCDIRKGQDGYECPWHGRVYVNGPYSQASRTAQHIAYQIAEGRVTEVISVCPAAVGSNYWARWVWPHVAAVAFAGRLPFKAAVDICDKAGKVITPAGTVANGNRTEIAVCYYGPRWARFACLASVAGWHSVRCAGSL